MERDKLRNIDLEKIIEEKNQEISKLNDKLSISNKEKERYKLIF